MPVESFPPKTNAINVTFNISMPRRPALASPMMNAPEKIKMMSSVEKPGNIKVVSDKFQTYNLQLTNNNVNYAGNWIVNFAPSPSLLSTFISPPWALVTRS